MRAGLRLLWAALLLAGCAHAPLPAAPPPAPPPRVKLAVLPVESDAFPHAAEALNAQMRDVKVRGVDDYFLSKVTLEVVQLSIECVEPSSACYSAVGQSLSAQRLLIAQLQPAPGAPPPRSRHRRRDKTVARPAKQPVRVTITLFDVGAGEATHVADRTFKSDGEAALGIEALLQEAIGSAPAASARSATP